MKKGKDELLLELEKDLQELLRDEVKQLDSLWKNIDSDNKFSGILASLTKAELDQIRRLYNFKGISSLNKSKLVLELTKLIPAHLEKTIYALDQEMYNFLKKIIRKGGLVPATKPYEVDKLDVMMKCGLAFSIENDGYREVIMPEELMNRFKELDGTKLKAIVKRNTEWITLTHGMLYYYGAMTPDHLVIQLQRVTNNEVDSKSLFDVLYISADYYGQIDMTSRGLSDFRVNDIDEVLEQHNMRPDLDYYPFTKQQLLKAGEPEYMVRTPEINDLIHYMKMNYDLPSDVADDIMFDLNDLMNNDVGLNGMMNFLQSELEFPTLESLKEATDKVVNVYNTTPQWFLKGYSPSGLRESSEHNCSNKDVELRSNVIPFRASDKTGRNEPCPCGSGKKYKKCCGK